MAKIAHRKDEILALWRKGYSSYAIGRLFDASANQITSFISLMAKKDPTLKRGRVSASRTQTRLDITSEGLLPETRFECAWIDGEGDDRKRCEGVCLPRKPYCAHHVKLSYTPAEPLDELIEGIEL